MEATSSASGAPDSAEIWKKAKKTAETLGYVPASFSIAVRTLIQDQNENDATLRPVTKYQAARLLKTPTFQSMIYYGSQDLRGGHLQDKDSLSVGTMMDLFEPFDIAAMIACFVYFRKAKKLLNDEQWSLIQTSLTQDSQMGAQLGVAIPSIGIASGLIVGTMRQVGLAALVAANQKGYTQYEKFLKGEGKAYDFKKEEEIFGCSSEQVGVFTLSKMGFGVDVGQAFTVGFDMGRPLETIKEPLQLKMRLSRLWIDALRAGEDHPGKQIPGEYYPVKEANDKLKEEVQQILGGRECWLAKRKDDISPEKTPLLFKKAEVSEEIPEDLADVFSLEEITAMEEEDFDDLVDQIDDDQENKSVQEAEKSLE